MIYLDNAATSFPKPRAVVNAVTEAFYEYGANPGRGGHEMSVNTAGAVFAARQKLDDLFNGGGVEKVCFTSNCTQALNIAVNGLVEKGSHIVISCLEHNSVYRTVYRLKEVGYADFSVFNIGRDEVETLKNFREALNKRTKLCVLTAVSNVFGDILPLKEMCDVARQNGVTVIVDGAQGAGVIPLDISGWGINCLCAPGHKGLLGPMGTGCLLINGVSPRPFEVGGTGTMSMSASQPSQYPERLESGTLNVPGICGLSAGTDIVKENGTKKFFEYENNVCRYLAGELQNIDGVCVYVPFNGAIGTILSFNVSDMHSESVALELSRGGIAVRGGFHCSPLAHKFRGTEKQGVVRISPSFETTEKDINILLNLVRKIAIKKYI